MEIEAKHIEAYLRRQRNRSLHWARERRDVVLHAWTGGDCPRRGSRLDRILRQHCHDDPDLDTAIKLLRPDWQRVASQLPGDPPPSLVGSRRFPHLQTKQVIKLSLRNTRALIELLSGSDE